MTNEILQSSNRIHKVLLHTSEEYMSLVKWCPSHHSFLFFFNFQLLILFHWFSGELKYWLKSQHSHLYTLTFPSFLWLPSRENCLSTIWSVHWQIVFIYVTAPKIRGKIYLYKPLLFLSHFLLLQLNLCFWSKAYKWYIS